LIEVSELEVASLKEQHTLLTTEALTRIMEVLTEAEGSLRDVASKKIFIEVVLLKAIQARNAPSVDDVLKQLVELREEAGGGTPPAAGAVGAGSRSPSSAARPAPVRSTSSGSTASVAVGAGAGGASPAGPAPTPSPNVNPVPAASRPEPALGSAVAQAPQALHAATAVAAPPAGAILTEDDLVALWQNILEAVGRASPFAKNYLIEAHPVSLAKNVFTIGFDPEFAEHIDLVNNQKTHTLLQTKLSESGRPNTQIKFIKAERPENWAQVSSAPAPESTEAGAGSAPAELRPAASPGAFPAGAQPRPAASDNRPTPEAQAGPGAAPGRKEKAPQAINAEEFKKDPLIQQALEIFKGRIVEVRA
jgi:DNA polymerase-3 subunit gamma/tau